MEPVQVFIDPVHVMQALAASTLEVTRPDHEVVAEIAGRLVASSIQTPEWESIDEQGIIREVYAAVKVGRAILAEARLQRGAETSRQSPEFEGPTQVEFGPRGPMCCSSAIGNPESWTCSGCGKVYCADPEHRRWHTVCPGDRAEDQGPERSRP